MKLKGFTLAEVLITLAVIGVIAAVTIPVISTRTDEAKFITQLHKAQNTLINTIKITALENDNLPMKHWRAIADVTAAQDKTAALFNALSANFIVKDDCSNLSNCLGATYATLGRKLINNDWKTNILCALTTDGITFCMLPDYSTVIVDVNGPQRPNAFGIDTFIFGPIDEANNTINPKNDLATCDKDATAQLYTTSGGCTEWVLEKGNMDYRRKTVSW